MWDMPTVDLDEVMEILAKTGMRTHQLWLNEDSLRFVAGGARRSEFHISPSGEVQHSLMGDLHLHYWTLEGKEEVKIVLEGPAFTSRLSSRTLHVSRLTPFNL
jgi:3-hydroxyanthranilate 3,4-dioxygenase